MAYDPTTAPLNTKSTEADINSANQWMWQQPWYQDAIRSFGQQMGNVHLNDQQKRQLGQVIAAHGFPLPSNDEIDPAGNVNPKGHKMRNFLIAAAIGGATIATLGAAGAFAGAAGAGSAGASGAAGAAAGTGAGIGVGETGAALGLAGSGLGAVPATASTIGLAGGAGAAAPLASTTIGSGYIPAVGLGSGSSASAAGLGSGVIQGAKGGSAISNLLKNPDTYSDAAKAFGSYANSEAGNRETTGNFTQRWDQLRLQAEKDRREAESDALRKLAQTGYLSSGGNPYKPATMLDGSVLPAYGFGPKAPSQAQLEAAKTLEGQLLARVQPGAGFQPSPLESYTKPGTGEKIGRYGALIGSGLGIASKFF